MVAVVAAAAAAVVVVVVPFSVSSLGSRDQRADTASPSPKVERMKKEIGTKPETDSAKQNGRSQKLAKVFLCFRFFFLQETRPDASC